MHEKPRSRPAAGWMAWMLLAVVLLSACGGAAAPAVPAPTAGHLGNPAPTVANAPAPIEAVQPTKAPQLTEATQPTAAAQPAAGALRRDRQTLVVAYQESADYADPAQTLNVANNIITRPIYEGLLTLKGSSLTEVEPVLAESYTTNADKSEWTFKIRQGVKFHDGSPLDAQAVYDSYARTIVGKFPTWNILGRFVGEDPAKTMKVADQY